MPDVSYSATGGRSSRINAEDQLAAQQQEFLFRNQLAQERQRQAELQNQQFNRELDTRVSLADADRNAQREISGTFGDRSAAAQTLQELSGKQALGLEGVRGQNALGVAREGNAPAMAAIGLDQRRYDDSRADTAPARNLKNNLLSQLFPELANAPASIPQSRRGLVPIQGAREDLGGTSGGGIPGKEDAPPAADDSQPVPGTTPRAIPGRGQYQFDDKSGRDQASMLDQLKGQVDPTRWQQAVDQLDNSRKQQGERQLKAMSTAVPEVEPATNVSGAVDAVTTPQNRGLGDLSKLDSTTRQILGATLGINLADPDASEKAFQGTQREAANRLGWQLAQSDDPAKRAQGVSILKSQGVQVPDELATATPAEVTARTRGDIAASTDALTAIEGAPEYQQISEDLKKAAVAGDEIGYIQSAARLRQSLLGAGVRPPDVEALVKKAMQDAAPSAVSDVVRGLYSTNPLYGAINQARDGGAFPWRGNIRKAAGL